jgi:hypothetical protein
MSLISRLFGRNRASTASPAPEQQPEPQSPAARAGAQPHDGPALNIKRLPLDQETLTRIGPPSALHPPVQPARIVDDTPRDYAGDLYFRIFPLKPYAPWRPKKYVALSQKGRLEDQPGQRLACCVKSHVAQGQDRHLFESPGKLRPDFQSALPGCLMAIAKTPFPEYTADNWPLASARFRRVLEELEPGAHLFIPIDLSHGSEEPRLYVFFSGATFRPTAVAIEANGIPVTENPDGGIRYSYPQPVDPRFYYLNRGMIGSAEVFVDHGLGLIFSKRALERLGDILPRRYAFAPIGVCDEAIPAGAGRYTRDGEVHWLS